MTKYAAIVPYLLGGKALVFFKKDQYDKLSSTNFKYQFFEIQEKTISLFEKITANGTITHQCEHGRVTFDISFIQI